MSLAERLAEPPVKRRTRCMVGEIIDVLPEADRNALMAALDDHRYSTTQLAEAVTAEGHRISDKTLGRHRRGECCCVSR